MDDRKLQGLIDQMRDVLDEEEYILDRVTVTVMDGLNDMMNHLTMRPTNKERPMNLGKKKVTKKKAVKR